MENGTKIYPATPESFWAAINAIAERQAETERQIAETERLRKEAIAETERLRKEADARFEQLRAETERLRKEAIAETERRKKEADRRKKKADAEFELLRAETERQEAETKRVIAETAREVEKVNQTLGAWANNQGRFAEEYFFNSFEKGQQNFFGEKFDRIEGNVKGIKEKFQDEYDILLINGKSVGIIEVKYKGHESDIPKVVKKAETFRRNFPDYQNHKVYLGLATLAFYPKLEQGCINEGIAVIKQAGDTVIINDEHLKAY